jgi:hypothetical protein
MWKTKWGRSRNKKDGKKGRGMNRIKIVYFILGIFLENYNFS